MKEVAVAILNYNGIDFLKKFLPKVIDCSPHADIIVIDNASTDDSVKYVNSEHPLVKLVKLNHNYGFAGGYNVGLKEIKNPYFILLNSDVEVTPDWIEPLISRLKSNQSIAAVQPKILDFYRRDHFEYAGGAGGHLDVLGYAFCKGRVFDSIERDDDQFNKSEEIFWASGACFAVKRVCFEEFNGFDEQFFAHMEEIDLCWRFKNQGYKLFYEPESKVFHVGGGTLNKSNPFKTYLNFRNNLSMLFKNMPLRFVFPILFLRLILDGVSAFKYLLDGQFKNILAILKAHFAFYALLPSLIKKRSREFYGFKDLKKTSIVWQYFVKGKKTFSEICSK